MAATIPISCRVSPDFVAFIDKSAAELGVNRSQYLQDVLCKQATIPVSFASGGTLNISQTKSVQVPDELKNMLIAGGVAVVGIGAYSFIYNAMSTQIDENTGQSKFTKGECEFISLMCGVAIAMGGYGVYKAFTK